MSPAKLRLLFLALLALGAARASREQAVEERPLVLGSGDERYVWVRDWMKLPEGRTLGTTHGCVVVDSQDRVYVNTDTEDAVMVFAPDGTFLRSFGAELAGGLHGMAIAEEGGEEFLYLTHIRRSAVYKATLDGEILWELGHPAESGLYEEAAQYHPTSVAVLPDGGFLVADGYGRSWIHRYGPDRAYLGSIAGPGTAPGKARNPHGLLLGAGAAPRLYVADRENRRVQVLELDGTPRRQFTDGVGRPCHLDVRGGRMAIADILGKVTILDHAGAPLVHLGANPDPEQVDRPDLPVGEWRDGLFIAPHCVRWDSRGDLYVAEWQSPGRVTKLVRLE